MGITINTNIQSLFAQRALRSSTKMVGSSIEKLSTGSRINRAGDDAAGLSIQELREITHSKEIPDRISNDSPFLLIDRDI